MKAEVLYSSQCYLGEGPMWHSGRKSCFWVDIEGKKFFEYNFSNNNKEICIRSLNHRVTFIVQDSNDNLVLGLEGGIGRYDLNTEKFTWLVDLEKEKHKHRCNDGKADTKGRLWVGTLHMDFDEGAGSLYCLSENFQFTKKLGSLTISNGMAWSPDNKRFYFIDSPTNKVQSFFFDETSGNIYFEKDAIIIPKHMGAPDGMAIDEEGMLWIAQWGGFGVYRWNPHDGKLLEILEVPVPNVSSCAFVGENLDHLLITTARQDLDEEYLKKYPGSGDVFLQKLSVIGMPSNKLFF
ncbi:MAG TPA: SMP-30/gluconolactonase/LRE family protein [Puia sp.]|nr:SMP-30/gluconolactonase/LRE family protein [Puia sp.]